tara:strand:+ start:146 stop:655 length:510 start_codon:yes stop_codon:yes gene_type:complete
MAITLNGTTNVITPTSAVQPTGGILQVVQTTTSTQVSNDTINYVDTGLTGNITPASTSNKILILVCQAYENKRSSTSNGGDIKLMRDSTDINFIVPGSGNNYGLYFYAEGSSGISNYDVYNLSYLDSPNTTSQITYKTQCSSYSNSNSASFRAQSGGSKSFLTLMEIAG